MFTTVAVAVAWGDEAGRAGAHGAALARQASMVVALDTSELAETILPVVTEWCTHLALTPWLSPSAASPRT